MTQYSNVQMSIIVITGSEYLKTYRFDEIILIQDNYYVSKDGDLNRGWPKGSLFNSYYTEV